MPTPAPSAPQANHSRVVDVLRTWDTDGDGVISRKEFEKGLRALGLHGDQAEIDELFASMDVNGDGTLDYTELHRLLRVGAAAKKSSYLRDAVTNKPLRMPTSPSPGGGAMAHLGGRESPRCATTLAQSAPPVSEGGSPAPVAVREETWPEGLRNVLLREMGRVIDLFRHWEGGEAGRITVDHFKAGLYILGHHTTTADVLELYAAMGVDVASAGYAALPFRELRAQLRVAAQRGRSHYLRAAIRQGLQLEAAGPRGATHSGVVPTTPATEASAAGDAIAAALALSGAANCWTTPASAGASAAAAAVEQLRAAVSAASSASGAAAEARTLARSRDHSSGVIALGADAAAAKARGLQAAESAAANAAARDGVVGIEMVVQQWCRTHYSALLPELRKWELHPNGCISYKEWGDSLVSLGLPRHRQMGGAAGALAVVGADGGRRAPLAGGAQRDGGRPSDQGAAAEAHGAELLQAAEPRRRGLRQPLVAAIPRGGHLPPRPGQVRTARPAPLEYRRRPPRRPPPPTTTSPSPPRRYRPEGSFAGTRVESLRKGQAHSGRIHTTAERFPEQKRRDMTPGPGKYRPKHTLTESRFNI